MGEGFMITCEMGEGSVDQPGKGLRADSVDGAGKKTVGYCCIPCLHQIHKKESEQNEEKSGENRFFASIAQVDSLICPVVAQGVNTISAPFTPSS